MQQPNQHAASTYRANYTSRNRLLIEYAYRSSWIIGVAVDAIPDDMTKKGVRITSEIDPKRRGVGLVIDSNSYWCLGYPLSPSGFVDSGVGDSYIFNESLASTSYGQDRLAALISSMKTAYGIA